MPLIYHVQVHACRYTAVSKSSFTISTLHCRAVDASLQRQLSLYRNKLKLPCIQISAYSVACRRSYASKTPKQPPRSSPPTKPAASPVTSKGQKDTKPTATASKSGKSAELESSNKSFTGTRGTPLPPPSSESRQYPVQLLIYNAGIGRITFIACVKLTSIFIFFYFSFLVAPAFYYSPFEETWKAGAAVVGGAIPLLFTAFTTPPFVTYVHLALPNWARASYPRLVRYARNLPGSAIVDVTTLRWIWPRVTRLRAQELYIYRSRIGSMTLRRTVPQEVRDELKWYSWRPLRKFYVAGKGGRSAEKGIWEEVLDAIVRGWGERSAHHEGALNPSQIVRAERESAKFKSGEQ